VPLPRVKFRLPPLALTAGVGCAMWLLSRVLPGLAFDFPAREILAAGTGVGGGIFTVLGVRAFRSVGTTVNPNRPDTATTLVAQGVYGISRNPMYLGFVLLTLAWGLWLANGPGMLLPAALAAHLNWRQIPREEAALGRAFGESFESYKAAVRRWI